MEKRLFIGIKIDPTPNLLKVYNEIKNDLKDFKIKWVDIENLHITIQFLGNTNEQKIPAVKQSLSKIVAETNSFQLEIKGAGSFSKRKEVKVIWIGIDKKDELNNLANHVIAQMEELGFEKEKEYSAHLTIGRVNSFLQNDTFRKIADKYYQKSLQTVKVEEIILFESLLKSNGPKYLELWKFYLQAPEN